MLTRVGGNSAMTLMPFFLEKVLGHEATVENPTPLAVGLVPLFSYTLSMLFSMKVMRPLTGILKNRYLPMAIAFVIIFMSSIPMFNLNKFNRGWIYPLAAIQSIGLSIMLNTATSLISDLIGHDIANSAFVYGSFGFIDQGANGAILFYIVSNYSDDAVAL